MDKHKGKIVVAVLLVAFLLFGFFAKGHMESEGGSSFVLLLFAIPILLQLFVAWTFDERPSKLCVAYIGCISFSLTYLIFWWLYMSQPSRSTRYSVGCIVISVFLMGIAFFVTWMILQSRFNLGDGSKSPYQQGSVKEVESWSDFTEDIQEHPFSTVMFALSLFLCIAALLSFAFAFHDKWDGGEALYASSTPKEPGEFLFNIKLPSGSDLSKGKIPEALREEFERRQIPLAPNTNISLERKGSNRWWITDEDNNQIYRLKAKREQLHIYRLTNLAKSDFAPEIQKIFFEEDSATVETDPKYGTDLGKIEEYIKELPIERGQENIVRAKLTRVIRNNKALDEIKETISRYNTHKRLLITLIGRSGDPLAKLRLLFSIEWQPPNDLAGGGDIPTSLKQAFKENGHPLLPTAVLSVEEQDRRWQVNDNLGGQKYTIEKNDDRLHIYEGPNPPYPSNANLSEVRAAHVCLAIMEKNKKMWNNIEWLILSTSNEPFMKNTEEPEKDELLDRQRSVEVLIEPRSESPAQLPMTNLPSEPRDLKLLDYVYFTIYTITTTGYGDIIPITELAKFIASIANLFELFFLVIFFNVLLSATRVPGEELENLRLNIKTDLTNEIRPDLTAIQNQIKSLQSDINQISSREPPPNTETESQEE